MRAETMSKSLKLVKFCFLQIIFFALLSCSTIDKDNLIVSSNGIGLGNHEIYFGGRFCVVDETTQMSPVVSIYDLEFIKAKVQAKRENQKTYVDQAPNLPQLPSLMGEPLLPSEKTLAHIIAMYEKGDLLMYYGWVNWGWALWRNGEIIQYWTLSYSSL